MIKSLDDEDASVRRASVTALGLLAREESEAGRAADEALDSVQGKRPEGSRRFGPSFR